MSNNFRVVIEGEEITDLKEALEKLRDKFKKDCEEALEEATNDSCKECEDEKKDNFDKIIAFLKKRKGFVIVSFNENEDAAIYIENMNTNTMAVASACIQHEMFKRLK